MEETKECPSCALEVDASEEVCPYCSYEFPRQNPRLKYYVLLFVVLMTIWLLW